MDRRRNNGPENSYVPSHSSSSAATYKKKPSDLLNASRAEEDGRSLESLRPIFMKCGMISNANGSAYVEAGSTRIVASVYGPLAQAKSEGYSEKASLNIDFKYATFSCKDRRRAFQKDGEEQDATLRIFEALQPAIRLEAYAKSSIQITILVLESDGACLAHAITCASLALLNAGIEMRDIAIGSSVGFFPGNLMALDCSETEKVAFDQSGELVLSYLPSVGSISQIIFNGNVENSLLSQAVGLCTESCLQLQAIMIECIQASLAH